MHVTPGEAVTDEGKDRINQTTDCSATFFDNNNNNNDDGRKHSSSSCSPSPPDWTSSTDLHQHHRLSRPSCRRNIMKDKNECTGCRRSIFERYFLFVGDQRFHVSCLKCIVCHVSLDTEVSCFSRDGKIYCKQDYYRLVLLSFTKNFCSFPPSLPTLSSHPLNVLSHNLTERSVIGTLFFLCPRISSMHTFSHPIFVVHDWFAVSFVLITRSVSHEKRRVISSDPLLEE